MRSVLVLCFLLASCSGQPADDSAADGTMAVESASDTTLLGPKEPSPLDSLDFIIAGVGPGTDSVAVASQLGRPERILASEGGNGEILVTWGYKDLTLHFFDTPGVSAVEITGPTYSTFRQIRVGDPEQRIAAAYGTPPDVSSERWRYCDPQFDECLRLVRFEMASRRVVSIYVGNVLD